MTALLVLIFAFRIANLDRFALQVQSDALILANDWSSVGQVIDLCQQLENEVDDTNLSQAAKIVGSIDINSVVLGEEIKECYVLFLQWLSNHSGVTPRNSLLTDRTFLVKAPRILRAQAALEGRNQVEVQDMLALRHMTTFRIPATVHQQVCELLRLLAETSPNDNNNNDDDSDNDDFGGGNNKDGNNKMVGYLKNIIEQYQDGGGPRVSNPPGPGESKLNTQQEDPEGEETDDGSNQSKEQTKQKKRQESEQDAIDQELLADIGGLSVLHASVASFMTTSKDLKERSVRPLRRLWGAAQGPEIKLNLHSAAVSGAENRFVGTAWSRSAVSGTVQHATNPWNCRPTPRTWSAPVDGRSKSVPGCRSWRCVHLVDDTHVLSSSWIATTSKETGWVHRLGKRYQ